MQKATRGKLNDNLLNYLAGFFDGEGTICISKAKNYRSKKQNYTYILNIRVCGKDKEIIEIFHNIFSPKNKLSQFKYRAEFIAYQWGITGINARKWLEMMLPYLILKKERAKNAIDFQKYKTDVCSKLGGYLTEEHKNKQIEFYKKQREFNKKNVIDCSRND